MQAPVGFIELRKSKGYTQQQLGLLVAEETARRIKSHYAQKKVSYWESGQTSPNRDEIAALARIFGVQPEEIDSIFRLAPLSAADIFEDLAHSRRPSLVAA